MDIKEKTIWNICVIKKSVQFFITVFLLKTSEFVG